MTGWSRRLCAGSGISQRCAPQGGAYESLTDCNPEYGLKSLSFTKQNVKERTF